ncbi:MAG: LysR family transcriptional regulator [Burkholderiaceae bacterium]
MRLFAKAVELGSLAKAARAFGLSKTSVTRQLQRLETAVGQRLLHRGSGRFAMTEEGRELLLKVRDPLGAIDEAVVGLTDAAGRLEGRLRIATTYTHGCAAVAPALPSFMAMHPGLVVTLELSSRKVDLLADEADIAIRVGSPGSDQLVARLLMRDRVVLCASPAYLAARPPLRTLDDLGSHILLDTRPDPGAAGYELSDAKGRMRRLAVTVALRSNEPEALAIAARQGGGIAVISERFAAPWFADGSLIHVLPGCGLPARDINAMYAPGRRHSSKIRAFLDHLVAHSERFAIEPHGSPTKQLPSRPAR